MPRKKVQTKIHNNRLFIALMPPKNVRDVARDTQRHLSDFKYKLHFNNIEQIHLTLKFLGGNISQESTKAIIDSFDNLTHKKKFKLETEQIYFGFRGEKIAKILFLGFEPNQWLDDLKTEINESVKNLYLPDVIRKKDRKRFIPHITLARVKKDISKSHVTQIRERIDKINFSQTEFEVKRIHLIKSTLTKNGPVYTSLHSSRLH